MYPTFSTLSARSASILIGRSVSILTGRATSTRTGCPTTPTGRYSLLAAGIWMPRMMTWVGCACACACAATGGAASLTPIQNNSRAMIVRYRL